MSKLQAPCKDCKERTLGCHTLCERYQKFVKERRNVYKIRKLVGDANLYFQQKCHPYKTVQTRGSKQ